MPEPKLHDWRIEPREYQHQIERRGRKHAFESIDPDRTALVVIDMGDHGGGRQRRPARPRPQRLLHNIYRSFGDVRPTAEVVELRRRP